MTAYSPFYYFIVTVDDEIEASNTFPIIKAGIEHLGGTYTANIEEADIMISNSGSEKWPKREVVSTFDLSVLLKQMDMLSSLRKKKFSTGDRG